MTLSPLAIRSVGRVMVELTARAAMPSPRLQSTFATPAVRVTLLTRCFRPLVANGFMIRPPMSKMSSILAVETVSSWATRSATMAETCPIRFWAMKPWQNSAMPK